VSCGVIWCATSKVREITLHSRQESSFFFHFGTITAPVPIRVVLRQPTTQLTAWVFRAQMMHGFVLLPLQDAPAHMFSRASRPEVTSLPLRNAIPGLSCQRACLVIVNDNHLYHNCIRQCVFRLRNPVRLRTPRPHRPFIRKTTHTVYAIPIAIF